MTNIDVSAVFNDKEFQTKQARLRVGGFDGQITDIQLQHSKEDSALIGLERNLLERLQDRMGAEKSHAQITSELQTIFSRAGNQDGYVIIQKRSAEERGGEARTFTDRARIEIPNPKTASDNPDIPVQSHQESDGQALAL